MLVDVRNIIIRSGAFCYYVKFRPKITVTHWSTETVRIAMCIELLITTFAPCNYYFFRSFVAPTSPLYFWLLERYMISANKVFASHVRMAIATPALNTDTRRKRFSEAHTVGYSTWSGALSGSRIPGNIMVDLLFKDDNIVYSCSSQKDQRNIIYILIYLNWLKVDFLNNQFTKEKIMGRTVINIQSFKTLESNNVFHWNFNPTCE